MNATQFLPPPPPPAPSSALPADSSSLQPPASSLICPFRIGGRYRMSGSEFGEWVCEAIHGDRARPTLLFTCGGFSWIGNALEAETIFEP